MKKTDKVSWSLLSDKFVQQISLQDSGIGKMCMPDTGNQEKQDKPQKPPKLYHFLQFSEKMDVLTVTDLQEGDF